MNWACLKRWKNSQIRFMNLSKYECGVIREWTQMMHNNKMWRVIKKKKTYWFTGLQGLRELKQIRKSTCCDIRPVKAERCPHRLCPPRADTPKHWTIYFGCQSPASSAPLIPLQQPSGWLFFKQPSPQRPRTDVELVHPPLARSFAHLRLAEGFTWTLRPEAGALFFFSLSAMPASCHVSTDSASSTNTWKVQRRRDRVMHSETVG